MPVKAIETKHKSDTYVFNTLPATTGLEVFSQIMSIAGDAIAELAPTVAQERKSKPEGDDTPSVQTSNPETIGKVARALFRGMGDPQFAKTVRTLIGEVHKNGRPVRDFDQEFSGEYGAVFALLVEALKANYAGFLAGSGAGGVLANLAAMTQEHRTSTGESGG